MSARHRTREGGVSPDSGTFRKHDCLSGPPHSGAVVTYNVSGSGYKTFSETCDDVVGNYPNDNAFKVTKREQRGGYFKGSGVCPQCGAQYGATGSLLAEAAYGSVSHLPVTLRSADYTNIAARTTPNRPDVDIPVNLLELRDIPKLVHLAGKSLLGKAASANLCYNFGWAPLLGDLGKLWEFSKYYHRRVKNLRGLSQANGLRRRVSVDSKSASSSVPSFQVSTKFGKVFTSSSVTTTNAERWATIRWKLAPGYRLPPEGSNEEMWTAARLVLGLGYSHIVSAAWEAIPFSWLADWFGNIGDHLMLTRNTIPVKASGTACIMTRTITLRIIEGSSHPSMPAVKIEPTVQQLTTKERGVVSGSTLSFELPEFNVWQLGILGSLSVLKAEAWRGGRVPRI